MADVTVIIPSRGEQFLNKTIRDVVAKSRIETEVIAILDGYWPEDIVDDPAVHYIHFSKPRGMRPGLNAGVAIARGKFVMKLDAHCMVAEGFDKVLAETCRDNWVCVPTRHRLDPEAWKINDGTRPPINYQYLHISDYGVGCKEWRAKDKDRSLDAIRIDDIIGCQGSCIFLPRDFWYELELLDVENYGTFRKDPQEIMFKALSVGGRCVRVKDTWYAHLHKGRKYGRGYRASKSDHRKGDQYSLKWMTDEAWDKAQIPFREIVAKFPDMPGWEDHPWMKEKQQVTKALPNLYQYLELPDGKPFSRPNPSRAQSRFWNEGKWKSFVAPLLPKDVTDQTFVEMGTDAGLFLKMAKDYGYRTVTGIEKNQTPVKWGRLYRDTLGYDYTILKRTLGGKFHENGTFDIDELPVADLTLMSTFHYYININSWIKYLDRLKAKSCYVLIVSRTDLTFPLGQNHWQARADLDAVRGYFYDWGEMGLVENVPKEGDSKPRDLYSVLFQSPVIQRIPIEDIDLRFGAGKDGMPEAVTDLAERIAAGDAFDLFATDYYRLWKLRKEGRWSERALRTFVGLKAGVLKDVQDNGLKDPILVERAGLRLADGGHRLTMLKVLGHKSVIVRLI